MAQKRMFSLQIVDTDAFLDMPISSQLLYFHLVMRADDEGFVGNPKKIMRLIGTQEDDLKVLVAKRFLLVFESGVVVVKHWLIHNTIRMDRFNGTTYQDEKNTLQIKDNKSYSEVRQPLGNQMEPQVKLSKVNLSEVKLSKSFADKPLTPAEEAEDFFTNSEFILKEFIERTHAPPELLRNEFQKFILYWTEKNKSGTKQRWQTEKTFEVRRRIATWLGNVKQFAGTNNQKNKIYGL